MISAFAPSSRRPMAEVDAGNGDSDHVGDASAAMATTTHTAHIPTDVVSAPARPPSARRHRVTAATAKQPAPQHGNRPPRRSLRRHQPAGGGTLVGISALQKELTKVTFQVEQARLTVEDLRVGILESQKVVECLRLVHVHQADADSQR